MPTDRPLLPPRPSAFRLYDAAWAAAIPILRRHSRLSDGYHQRTLTLPPPRADIWIQAASAGEAYLALEIIRRLSGRRILATTNTRQGMDILSRAAAGNASSAGPEVFPRYFPFDRPALMTKAEAFIRPRVMVLLETELWPGLLMAMKAAAVPVVIANGRLSPKSLRRYALWPDLWKSLPPDRILAISEPDALRFRTLFPAARVSLMTNIKFDRFDRMDETAGPGDSENFLKSFISDRQPFVVLGSVRKEEEAGVINILRRLRVRHPEALIGLFPRHLHRVNPLGRRLSANGFSWRLRSRLTGPAPAGSVILWDVFGELTDAYGLARAVFVGGSLAALGGQNFLEPIIRGVVPVIGPHWEDFRWIGEDVFRMGLAKIGRTAADVADLLADAAAAPRDRAGVKARCAGYLNSRRGGTDAACEAILKSMKQSPPEA